MVADSCGVSFIGIITRTRSVVYYNIENDIIHHIAAAHLVVHADGVVHGLHPAPGDALDVDLLLALGQLRQALAVVREVGHRVVVGVPAEWLKHQH